jgi:hypothetical protein
MDDLRSALRLVDAKPEDGFFVGPRDPVLIASAERALGGRFPPTYREFVAALGAGDFGGFEVYGVIDGEFEEASVPNGVWLTLHERKSSGLPPNLVIVASTGDGSYYCVEMSDDGDTPVVVYQPGYPPDQQRLDEVAEDFSAFLLSCFQC